jgi:hypothetical protein
MGLDLLITATAIDQGRMPDWGAAGAAIAALDASALDEFDDDFSGVDELQRRLRSDLEDMRAAFSEPVRRDATTLEVRGLVIYVAGGMSSGDPPSELYGSMRRLLRTDVLMAAGFGAS